MRYKGVELHSDEESRAEVRQYAARLVIPFSLSILILIGIFFFFIPLWNLRIWGWDIHTVGQTVFWAALFFALLYALRAFVIWRGTMLIVTNQRIIDVERRGFFDRMVSEVPYQSLSDVSYRSKGLIEMSFGIGTINFQLYSGNENVSFRHLLNPAALHKRILELRIAYMRGDQETDDPVEVVLDKVKRFTSTEQQAILTTLKKTVPKRSANKSVPPAEIS